MIIKNIKQFLFGTFLFMGFISFHYGQLPNERVSSLESQKVENEMKISSTYVHAELAKNGVDIQTKIP